MRKKVNAYEIIQHGIEHEQYFQGCGVAHTSYSDVVTGIGSTEVEAFQNALDQLTDMGYTVPADLDVRS